MRKGKFFVVELPLWHHDFWVSVGQTDAEFKKSLKGRIKPSRTITEEDIFTLWGNGETFVLGNSPEAIRIKHFPKTPETYKTLVHELMHVVSKLMRRNGLPLTDESEEAYCYTIGYCTEEILKKCQ